MGNQPRCFTMLEGSMLQSVALVIRVLKEKSYENLDSGFGVRNLFGCAFTLHQLGANNGNY